MKEIDLGTSAAMHEALARNLADMIRAKVPAALGFTLFLFDQGKDSSAEDPTHVTYLSTAAREDMVVVLRGWLLRQNLPLISSAAEPGDAEVRRVLALVDTIFTAIPGNTPVDELLTVLTFVVHQTLQKVGATPGNFADALRELGGD